MEEFLIRLGKIIYYGWFFEPTDVTLQNFQLYNIGLSAFILGCVSLGILVIGGIAYLVKKGEQK